MRKITAPRSDGIVVLVVEDDALLRWDLYDALARSGFRVYAALDAEAAAELSRKRTYDVVVANARRPGAAEQMRRLPWTGACPPVVLVAATSSRRPSRRAPAILRGPVHPGDLTRAVREVCRGRARSR